MSRKIEYTLQRSIDLSPQYEYLMDYYYRLIKSFIQKPLSFFTISKVDYAWCLKFLNENGFKLIATRKIYNQSDEPIRFLGETFDFETDENNTKLYSKDNKYFVIVQESLTKLKGVCNKIETKRPIRVAEVYLIYNLEDEVKIRSFGKELVNHALVPAHLSFINFLTQHSHGFSLKKVEVDFPPLDIELHYGKEFLSVYQELIDFFNSDKIGLALLHGLVGTGKTSIIKHLVSLIPKKVVYVPAHLINSISDPAFLTFMLEQRDMVLVIEDAEQILIAREDNQNSAGVSNLLNLTDGILGSALKVQALCTFNTEIHRIDNALLRKGRLAVKHEFKKLSTEEANKLLGHLKINHTATEPMSLAEVYNLSSKDYTERQKKQIGFGK